MASKSGVIALGRGGQGSKQQHLERPTNALPARFRFSFSVLFMEGSGVQALRHVKRRTSAQKNGCSSISGWNPPQLPPAFWSAVPLQDSRFPPTKGPVLACRLPMKHALLASPFDKPVDYRGHLIKLDGQTRLLPCQVDPQFVSHITSNTSQIDVGAPKTRRPGVEAGAVVIQGLRQLRQVASNAVGVEGCDGWGGASPRS